MRKKCELFKLNMEFRLLLSFDYYGTVTVKERGLSIDTAFDWGGNVMVPSAGQNSNQQMRHWDWNTFVWLTSSFDFNKICRTWTRISWETQTQRKVRERSEEGQRKVRGRSVRSHIQQWNWEAEVFSWFIYEWPLTVLIWVLSVSCCTV